MKMGPITTKDLGKKVVDCSGAESYEQWLEKLEPHVDTTPEENAVVEVSAKLMSRVLKDAIKGAKDEVHTEV